MKSLALQGNIAIGRNHKRSKKRFDSGEELEGLYNEYESESGDGEEKAPTEESTEDEDGYHGETLKLVHSESGTI